MLKENDVNNNLIVLTGKILTEPVFSHEIFGEGFYSFNVEAKRLSDANDVLPVTISERIIDRCVTFVGRYVRVEGQIRSHNSYNPGETRNRLVLAVFALEFEFIAETFCEEMAEEISGIAPRRPKSPNDVFLSGYICKPPIYRTTPFGREIADILIAVNRSYNKSDYIPCIAWGRNARFSGKLSVGAQIRVWGRMQSRAYQKKTEDGEVIDKMAYEVSISKLETDM